MIALLNIDKYNFDNYNEWEEFAKKFPDNLDDLKAEFTKVKSTKITNTNCINGNSKKNADKVSIYVGVSWTPHNNKWSCRLTKDNKSVSLGSYATESEAGIIYNDYASYLNENANTNYILNEIENYIPNPRNIVEELKNKKLEKKSSLFNGVYFITSKQIFTSAIHYKKKKYELCKNLSDIECAKIYNEQALYFNNHLGTEYKLNEIPNFETIEKNHVLELDFTKIKKYSRFSGVTIRNDTGKFRAYIKHNRQTIHCGSHETEELAALAYNKKAEELNQLETTKSKYKLNVI